MLFRFTNPNKSRSSPITKYAFLEAFTRGSEPPSKHVTTDTINLDNEQEEEAKCSPEEVSNKPLEGKHANACSMDVPLQHFADKEIPGCTDFVESDFDLKNQPIDTLSDDDDSSQISSSSTSTSNPSEFEANPEDQLLEDGSSAFKINRIKEVVDVFPDFIQYGDLYSTRSRLKQPSSTFSLNQKILEKLELQIKVQPETFINDTIIDFYIKYLKNKLPTDDRERFHFFNSFFFRKLADLDKDPSSACDGRAAFQRVRKWTRKVNLFEKDYILIPINYSLHWSLIVICHPDEEREASSKVPCILHMDSLKGSHKGLKNVFQSYLCEEWKERHANVVDDVSSKFLHLRFISLELPQQENLYDCGLFLLHYVEQFLKEAPINFNPFRITKFSNFLKSNWFPPPEASLKRSHIQNLIYDMFENNSLQAPPADCHDKGPPSQVPGVIKHKEEIDSPGFCCYPVMYNGKPSNSTTELETDILFSTALPKRIASCLREPGIVFNDLQAAVVTSHSDCLQMSACHKRGFMSPIEEAEEFDEETAISLERESSQVVLLDSDFPSTSYIRKDHRATETRHQEFSANFVEAVEGHSYSRTSAGVSCNTLDTSTHEDQPIENIEESNIPDKTALEYLSTSGDELANFVVQDSQEANDGDDVEVSVKSRSSFQENTNSVADQFIDLALNVSLEDDTLASKKEPLASESDERHAKRPKLMNATSGPSRRFTRSMLKKTCLMSCK
ncbi:Ulp1 protease family, C-terminal catalytic domain [Sesbania bispinosa]|nr:Ulp1 protease family, C-terminal catalytic domain [Sesbania bispinosa]